MADRQQILENNRLLRNIKDELETLLERGVITDDTFDSIIHLLPAESRLSGAAPGVVAAPQRTFSTPCAKERSLPPPKATSSFHSSDPSPPAYSQAGPPPALPARAERVAPQAEKAVLIKARALYQYDAADSRDVALQQNDLVDVYDYVNAEWWMGRNVRTGEQGIFPKTYVEAEQEVEQNLPPPMQVAETGSLSGFLGDSKNAKVKDQGSKLGKKLGKKKSTKKKSTTDRRHGLTTD